MVLHSSHFYEIFNTLSVIFTSYMQNEYFLDIPWFPQKLLLLIMCFLFEFVKFAPKIRECLIKSAGHRQLPARIAWTGLGEMMSIKVSPLRN